MLKLIRLFVLSFVLSSIFPYTALAIEQLAVMDLTAKHGVEASLAEALSVIIRDEIHSYGEYEVMSKEDLDAVAKRESMQQRLGCDDNGCLIKFGKALGTKYMVAGSLSKFGKTFGFPATPPSRA